MSKKKPKIRVARYLLTQHINVVEGPIDYFSRIWVGDKIAWEGKADENQILTINQPALFGGLRQQGGVTGDIHVLLGDPTQVISDFLAGKIDQASGADSPAFRYLAGLWFTETAGASLPGFYWQANSPFLPPVEAEPNFIPRDWYPYTAAIGGTEDLTTAQFDVASAASFEQMRNIWRGLTGSTEDFYDEESIGWRSHYYDHLRDEIVYWRANNRLFRNIISNDTFHNGKTENEEWDGAFRFAAISPDGKRTTPTWDPGYIFGRQPTGVIFGFAWSPDEPNTLYCSVYEYNYDATRLQQFNRASSEDLWEVNPFFLRSDDSDPDEPFWYLIGIRPSDGHLVVHEESFGTEWTQIRNKNTYALISQWELGTDYKPNTFVNASDSVILPGDLLVIRSYSTSNVAANGVRAALFKLDLQTGAYTDITPWGIGVGPGAEPNNDNETSVVVDKIWFNRSTQRLEIIVRIAGEFSHITAYTEYARASFAADLSDYQYHGRMPWTGLRTSADARATGFGDASFCRHASRFSVNHWAGDSNRNRHASEIGGDEYEQQAFRYLQTDVSGETFVNDYPSIMAIDPLDDWNFIVDWTDRLDSLPYDVNPLFSRKPIEDLWGTKYPSSTGGTGTDDQSFWDPISKTFSSICNRDTAHYLKTGARFGPPQTYDGEADFWYFDFYENTPRYYLSPAALCPLVNPMHVIYDVMKNDLEAEADIDEVAARYAADTFFNEGLGLSLLWKDSTTAEQFIDFILEHCSAVRYPSPHTGQIVYKPNRGDYDINEVRRLNKSIGVLTEFKRKGWGETVNQIDVTWTDPDTEEEKNVRLHEPGNIAQQGTIAGDSRNYPGVRSSELAMQLARRELRAAAYPLATMEFEGNQEIWDATPGEVFALDWTFRNGDTITGMAVRVIDVDRSHMESGVVRLSLAEDVFALNAAEFTAPPTGTELVTQEEPAELAFVYFFSAPYFFAVNLVDPSVAANIDEAAEETFFIQLGAQTGSDTAEYDVYGEETDSLGNTSFQTFGLNDIVARSVLTQALPAEARTTLLSLPSPTQGPLPVVGSWIVIGDGPAADQELAIVTATTPNIQIDRGMLDTVPKEWPVNTPVWVISDTADVVDNVPVAPGSYNYKLLTKTSLGTLALAVAQQRSFTATNRHYLPLRPADVVANGVAFGSVDRRGQTDVDLTWAKRNRLTEDAQVLAWDDADVTAEAGATVTVQALNFEKDTVLGEDTGLTGTSHSILATKWGSERDGYVKVISETASDESFQGHEFYVFFDLVGRGDAVLPVPIILGSVADVVGQGGAAVAIATLAGNADIVTPGSGAIAAPVPTLSGAAEQIQAATGAIDSTVPAISGLGTTGTFSFSGGILTPVPSLSGSGTVTPATNKTGSGAISATVPTLSGSGTVTP